MKNSAGCLLALSLTPLAASSHRTLEGTWPSAAYAKASPQMRRRVLAIKAQSPQAPKGHPRGIGCIVSDLTCYLYRDGVFTPLSPYEMDELDRRDPARALSVRSAQADYRSGKLEVARLKFERLLSSQADSRVLGFLSDIYMRQGRIDAAYQLLAAFAAQVPAPSLLMRLSLLAAKKGEIYDGQAGFCLDEIGHYFNLGPCLLKARTASNLVYLSSLCLGLESENMLRDDQQAMLFYRMATGWNHEDAVGHWRLARVYVRQGLRGRARLELQAAAKNGRGSVREDALRQLSSGELQG